MKHSKMFKMLLACLTVVALASTTFATLVTNSFESYTDGYDIGTNTATTGWYADEEVALATTSNNPTGYYAGYPITNITHDVSMAFENTVSNSIAGVENEGVYVDFLVQPTFWDEEDAPAVPANSQVALYFDTNGYANIYHTYEETFHPYVVTQQWTQISNVDAIGTQDWVRVTYEMFYDNTDYTYFKLWINGEAASSTYGYPTPPPSEGGYTTTNGTYFINSDCDGYGSLGDTKINSFTAKGNGTLDDFVVTSGDITPFEPPTPGSDYLIAITNLNPTLGAVVPGTDTNVAAGSDLTITITPEPGYKSQVEVDGGSAIETNAVVFSSVSADHVVLVDFILGNVPSSNGVDVASSWLQAYGLDLTSGNADAYWEAYLADVNPTNGSFEIISAEVLDGTNYIKWISQGQTAGLLPPFEVLGTDDLTNSSSWQKTGEVDRPSAFTTNVFEDSTKTYYKINATDVE